MGVVPCNRACLHTVACGARPHHCFSSGVPRSNLARRHSGNVCSSSVAVQRVGVRDARACALNTNDGTRCSFPASYDKMFRVGFPDTLPSYLGELESRITRFDLPLGANVTTRPNGEIVLEVCPHLSTLHNIRMLLICQYRGLFLRVL